MALFGAHLVSDVLGGAGAQTQTDAHGANPDAVFHGFPFLNMASRAAVCASRQSNTILP